MEKALPGKLNFWKLFLIKTFLNFPQTVEEKQKYTINPAGRFLEANKF